VVEKTPCRIVVLISGNGSNLQAIIDAIANNQISAKIVAVISNKAGAYGLVRATKANIATQVLSASDFSDRQQYDQALMACVDAYHPDLIVLAGFMRILSDDFVHHYLGKMFNIHPSLLPKYKGLDTHRRVLASGDKEHGATVHFVIPALDSGPIILQGKMPVLATDTEQQLAERVHEIEHRIYPQAIGWFAEGRLILSDNQVLMDHHPIPPQQQIYSQSGQLQDN